MMQQVETSEKNVRSVVVSTTGDVYKNGEYLDESVLYGVRRVPKRMVTRAILEQLRDVLTPRELRFVRRMFKLQEAAHDGRFRVSGALTPRREHVRMESEFIVDKEAAKTLRGLAHATGAKRVPFFEKGDGPEMQYALQWDVSGTSPGRLRARRATLKKATQKMWKAHGVSIL